MEDAELKQRIATARPYGEWLNGAVGLPQLVDSVAPEKRQARLLALGAEGAPLNGAAANGHANGKAPNGNGKAANGNGAASDELAPLMLLLEPLKAFGYSREGLEMLMVREGGVPVCSCVCVCVLGGGVQAAGGGRQELALHAALAC